LENGEKKNKYRILVRKPEGKRSIRRPWHRWEDIIKTDLREKIGITDFFWLRIKTSGGLLCTR
jgi:hypothetical protein